MCLIDLKEGTISSHRQFCIDRPLPNDLESIGNERARAENPANEPPPPSPFEAAAEWRKFWKPGRTLRVAFIQDADSRVRDGVIRFARTWSDHANIVFDFGDSQDAEIRIGFDMTDGSWSALGTDALVEEHFPRDGATMNYGWLTPESSERDYARVVLHEFGHALGLIHEHQNPAAGIRWNDRVVIDDLSRTQGWDLETIRHNVLDRYTKERTQFTEFDEKSIMLYTFPKEWTLDGQEFPENSELSEQDKEFVGKHYPKAATSVA
jgi:hypothetical protein